MPLLNIHTQWVELGGHKSLARGVVSFRLLVLPWNRENEADP